VQQKCHPADGQIIGQNM